MKETVTGYLLEKYNNMKGSYTCYRFLEEAAALGMKVEMVGALDLCADGDVCLLYTSPSPRDSQLSRMPSSA